MISLVRARLIIIGILTAVAVLTWFVRVPEDESCQCLQVTFFDVGQGDAIYIQTPDGFEVLVDGGKDDTVLRRLAAQQSFFDRSLDLVVATHPDLDHIGGLLSVLKRYHVDTILLSAVEHDTPAADTFDVLVDREQAKIIYAEAGQRFQLGAETFLTVLSPVGDESHWESNSASVVFLLAYGETEVLLTGDAPLGIEEYLVSVYGDLLEADILKLGHHGSRTSTSGLFLDTVAPQYAVVSASADNRYGHPHEEVIERIHARNIQLFQTGVDGSITFISDGEQVWME